MTLNTHGYVAQLSDEERTALDEMIAAVQAVVIADPAKPMRQEDLEVIGEKLAYNETPLPEIIGHGPLDMRRLTQIEMELARMIIRARTEVELRQDEPDVVAAQESAEETKAARGRRL